MKHVISYEIPEGQEGTNGAAILSAIKFAVPYVSRLGDENGTPEGNALSLMHDLSKFPVDDLKRMGAECAAAAKNFDMLSTAIFGMVMALDPEWSKLGVSAEDFVAVLRKEIDGDVDEIKRGL